MSNRSFKPNTRRVSFNSTPEVCSFVREQSSNILSKEIAFTSKVSLVGKESHVDLLTNDNLTDEISLDAYPCGTTVRHNIAQNVTTTTLESAKGSESPLASG